MTAENYRDGDGNPISLDALCRRDPAWAANRVRYLLTQVEARRAEAHLDQIYATLEGAGWHNAAALLREKYPT